MKTNRTLALVVVLLALVALVLYLRRGEGTLKEELSDFAVPDTGAITRVFIASKSGQEVTLEKQHPGRWIVNGTSRANNDMVNTLLETLHSMDVRSPVAKAAYNNVMKKMAATAVKVEIYRGEGDNKVFYVGHETQDQYGTFMYLEKSSVPFVVHIPGFDGYLTPRFSPVAGSWVPNVVFDHGTAEIARLHCDNRAEPASSFEIRAEGDGFVVAASPGGEPVEGVSQNKVNSYLEYFGKLYYEFTAKDLPDEKLDSIRATEPFLVMTLDSRDGGHRTARMFRMPRQKSDEELLEMGIVNNKPYDTDRFYVQIDDDARMHAAQYYVFGKLFIRPASLMDNGPAGGS